MIIDNCIDFINRKKENYERTSKEINILLKRMKNLIIFQTVFNIITIPTLLTWIVYEPIRQIIGNYQNKKVEQKEYYESDNQKPSYFNSNIYKE